MSLVSRVVTMFVVALLTTLTGTETLARAAGTEAVKAADYIVSTFKPGTATPYGDVGSAADSLMALASTADAKYDEPIAAIVTYLQTNAKDYVKAKGAGTAGAAKLALAAAAAKADAKSFGGVDLVEQITGGIGPDGAFGAYPGPFSSGLAMVALTRTGTPVPDSMVDYLLSYQQPRSDTDGGGFGCGTYPFAKDGDCPAADPDSTAMAVIGLRASGSTKAIAAADAALEWLKGTQMDDGSWQNYAPVNSTGLVGPLFPAGSDQATKAAAYVAGKQLESGALSTGTKTDTKANLLATQQGIFALTGMTYCTIGGAPATETSAVATPSASSTPSPPPAPAPEANNLPVLYGVGAVVLLAAAGTAVVVARKRKS